MAGLLDGSHAGLLGMGGQGSPVGDFMQRYDGAFHSSSTSPPTDQERSEYEQARREGFTGTFEEWRQRKRGSQLQGFMNMLSNLQPASPTGGTGPMGRTGGY